MIAGDMEPGRYYRIQGSIEYPEDSGAVIYTKPDQEVEVSPGGVFRVVDLVYHNTLAYPDGGFWIHELSTVEEMSQEEGVIYRIQR